jgi:DNA-binding MarR family transcriptional regulator
VSNDRAAGSPAAAAAQGAPEEGRKFIRAFLSEEEEVAWTGLLHTHAALVSALDARLLAEHDMPLVALEALMNIAHADGGVIAISGLAPKIHVSPSHTSRLVIDLERRGLVKRERDPNDSRSTRAAMTEAGWTELQRAGSTYLSTVRALLLDPLDEREVKRLARTWERIEAARSSSPEGGST